MLEKGFLLCAGAKREGNTGSMMLTFKSNSPGRVFFTKLLRKRIIHGNIYLEDLEPSVPGLMLQLGKGT